jgi:hypothetical protein
MAFGPLMRPQAIPQQCGIGDARRPNEHFIFIYVLERELKWEERAS